MIKQSSEEEPRYHFLTNSELFQRSRKSYVPAEGWKTPMMKGRNGKALANDLIKFQRQVKARSVQRISVMMGKRMRRIIQKVVTKGRKQVSERGQSGWTYGKKDYEQEKEIWLNTIAEVMDEEDSELEDELFLEYQATAKEVAGGFSKLLGFALLGTLVRSLIRAAKGIAGIVSRINRTTTNQLEGVVSSTLIANQAPADTGGTGDITGDITGDTLITPVTEGLSVADQLEEQGQNLLTSRVATISRTESTTIVNSAASSCLVESGRVLTVQVVGCEAIEPNIPEYNGVPTCNITGVPVEDADKLEFHPNHTGYIVPETFADETSDAGVDFSELDVEDIEEE